MISIVQSTIYYIYFVKSDLVKKWIDKKVQNYSILEQWKPIKKSCIIFVTPIERFYAIKNINLHTYDALNIFRSQIDLTRFRELGLGMLINIKQAKAKSPINFSN